MKKIATLGVSVVAAGALALGGLAGSAEAGKVCAYHTSFHITKRHNVSCKFAKKVLGDYLNNGSVKNHKGWNCPSPYNDQLGKCKKNKDTSFRYKNNY